MSIYSKEFRISSYDLNPRGQARMTTMANFLQEMAYQHASHFGLGHQDMLERNTIWVLSRMRIQMEEYPVWDDRIIVETWPVGVDKLFAIRDFRLKTLEGKIIGKASTAWLILDSTSHRLVRPGQILDEVGMPQHDERVFERGMEKLELPTDLKILAKRNVVFSDLDIIGHVNNVKYMEWCLDAFYADIKDTPLLKELEINFQHEAVSGDHIVVEGGKDEDDAYCFLARRPSDNSEIIRVRFQL